MFTVVQIQTPALIVQDWFNGVMARQESSYLELHNNNMMLHYIYRLNRQKPEIWYFFTVLIIQADILPM